MVNHVSVPVTTERQLYYYRKLKPDSGTLYTILQKKKRVGNDEF